MNVVTVIAPRWFDAEHTKIDCTVRLEHAIGGTLDVPYLAYEGDPEPDGRALFERIAALEFGAIAPYIAPPAPPPGEDPEQPRLHHLRKTELWRRCTEQEADAIDNAISRQTTRLQRIFGDATILDLDDPLMAIMRETMVRVFGEERTAVLLEPTE